jgi:hypothetical protein
MSEACTSQPISWLRLERYQLGELAASEREEISTHLQSCPVCKECIGQIEREAGAILKPLPELPERRPWLTWQFIVPAFAATAAAMVLALALPHGADSMAGLPAARVAIKGGELALSLVRERAGTTSADPTTFAPGDRFKALLTCPPPEEPFVELAVFQTGETSFPFAARRTTRCGNQAALDGAFTLTGSAATICVVVSAQPIDRQSLGSGIPAPLRSSSACVRLEPAK